MRFNLRRLRMNKRGVSGVVSGLFILVIALSIVIFIYETYQAQTQMSDWDAERMRERIEVSDVFFGEANQYSPNSVTPAGGPIANLGTLDNSYLQFNGSLGDQVATPVNNMNFTIGDDGWIFEKDPVSRDVGGFYTSLYGNPSPGSGLGSIFVQMTGLATGPYWMNWTYRFSHSQNTPSVTTFSWAKMVWSKYLATSFTVCVVITLPNDSQSVITGPNNLLSLNLTTWYYESIHLNSSVFTSPGNYALTLAVLCSTSDSGNPHDSGNAVLFFDDVGISAVYYEKFSTDFYGTFNTGRDPNILRRLQVYYGGHYTPHSGTFRYSPVSLITLGNTVNIGGSYQNLAVKDGSLTSFRSYTSATPHVYNPSSYTLLGQTTLQAGTIINLASDDGIYQSFRSYRSDIHQFVNNNVSNVDSSASKGTHSNFTAQQYGPDSIYDRITEANTGGGSSSFGTSTGSSYTTVSASYMYGSVFTSPTDAQGATLQNMTWYGRGDFSSGNAKAILVLHSTMQIIAVSDISSFTTSASERTSTFSSSPTLTGNTEYVLMMIFSTATRFYYGSGSTNQGHYDTTNSYSTPSNPTDASHNNNQYRIQAAYIKANNYELDLEAQWTNADYSQPNEELAIYANQSLNTHSLRATGGYMIVGGNPDWGSVAGTISFWVKWDSVGGRPWGQDENMETRFSGSNLVLDWGTTTVLTSSTSFVAGKWYFMAIVWNENTDKLCLYVGDENNSPVLDAQNNAWTSTVSTVGVTQNNFLASKGGAEPVTGRGDELTYWTTDRSLGEIQSNYKVQLTGSETNLRSYFKLDNSFTDSGPAGNNAAGSGGHSFETDTPFSSPNETIRVDVWSGGSWQNVLTDLSNGWNNVSVSSYLTSSTFTIRFKCGIETGDLSQDRWNIDAVLLHVWTGNIVEVELSGSTSINNWSSLNWTANSAWTVSGVSVTIQLFNYSMAQYPTNGNGYINYTSGAANTDETYSQAISSDPSTFRNGTGNWKVKIRGVKDTPTEFSFLCDWVEFKPSESYYLIDWCGEFAISEYAAFDQIDVSYWGYFNASTIPQTVYIYNWNTLTYDQIGPSEIYSTAGVSQWHNRTIDSNITDYSSPSIVRVRISAGSYSSGSFESYADFCNLGILGTITMTPVSQKLYVMDYANNQWHLLLTSKISTNDEMFGPMEINENVDNYADSQGTVLVRVASESETLVNCQANFMMIRLYSINLSKVTLEVTNLGSETVNLVRIYVVNSTGHSKIDLSTGINIDRTTISPGEQALLQIDYSYSTCQYTFKVITKRGTIAAYVKTAN